MDANIQKALTDRLYDKRKGGALELEGLIRDCLASADHERIEKIVHQLCHEYAYAVHQPHARNGGLIGLAAASIALGPEVARYLEEIVPPVLACFTDQDARVRYYACESMYNIAKVAKGEVLLYFNEVFDALSKLSADSELSVKNGAELLDRLVKDIVAESAANYVSVLQTSEEITGDTESAKEVPASIELPAAFSLPRFIPLLEERINVISPFTRTFLVSWITLLDSIPDLELVTYLPCFLGGLFRFLSDPNQDVHTATQSALERFLSEIKKIARIKKGLAESRKSLGDDGVKPSASSLKSLKSAGTGGSHDFSPRDERGASLETASTDTGSDSNIDEKSGETEGDWIPGQDVQVDYSKILEILVTFLSDASEQEIQVTALRWIDSFFEICAEEILPFVPRLLSQVLPALSHQVEHVRQAANQVNKSLMEYIVTLPDDSHKLEKPPPIQPQLSLTAATPSRDPSTDRREGNVPSKLSKLVHRDQVADPKTSSQPAPQPPSSPQAPAENASPSSGQTADLDYEAAVNALTLQFLHEYEATRVAALAWLIMLHRKAPRKILAINDGTFPALLKTLSDPSDSVVTRDLVLLSQIAKNSDDSFFTSFMVNLLKLFCTDRRLLETRGNLIIRQLCVSLSAERIYRVMADCLEKDEDVEFASIMVQNLNNNLITAPELADLRKRLRNLDTRDGQNFFVALFRAWCHNAVASISLCLLAQAYEQAYHLLQIFGELEMTVNMLIQIDKLVQLLESPVFTYLRLQLLEPERYPHLYKCLYGLLMLLPQSSAFAALKNRLNSVSAIGYLHIAPRATASGYVPPSPIHLRLHHHKNHASEAHPPGSPSSSAPPTPGVTTSSSTSSSAFERPNRLKTTRDDGSGTGAAGATGPVRWVELLDKFKTTQDRARRARRAQQSPGESEDAPGAPTPRMNLIEGAERTVPLLGTAAAPHGRQPGGAAGRPGSAGSGFAKAPPAATQGHQRGKSSLSNLGRFAGGVGKGKGKK